MYLTLKSGIAKPNRLCYNTHRTGMWLSWLARFAHIEEVGGSSPSIPTKSDRVLDTIHQEPYRFISPLFFKEILLIFSITKIMSISIIAQYEYATET